jgi:hypothetical protein
VREKIKNGNQSAETKAAVKKAFHENISARLRPMLEEKRRIEREQGLPHALECWNKLGE